MDGRRDRLSSLDLVPDHAHDDVVWAVRELNKRQRTQADILFELNDRLAVKGVEPISSSAFSRKAVRQRALRQRVDTAREVLAGVADMTAADLDKDTVNLGYTIMMLIAELTADGADRSTKELKEIAGAFKDIVSGQNISARRRSKVETDAEKRAATKTLETVAKVGREAGLSKENLKALEDGFFEVFGGRPSPKPEQPDAGA